MTGFDLVYNENEEMLMCSKCESSMNLVVLNTVPFVYCNKCEKRIHYSNLITVFELRERIKGRERKNKIVEVLKQ